MTDRDEARGILREWVQDRLAADGGVMDETQTGEPEVFIMVRQVVRGEMVETIKRLSLLERGLARISLADQLIDQGLAELRHCVGNTGRKVA